MQSCEQWKMCSSAFHFEKEIWEYISRFKKYIYLFLYIRDSTFGWHKCITCKFLHGIYRVVIKALFYQRKIPLTSQPHFIHVIAFPLSRMKHWKTKLSSGISDEHRASLLRIAVMSIEPNWCVTHTRPNIPLVLWGFLPLFFSFNLKKN